MKKTIILLFMALLAINVSAYDFMVDGIAYKFINGSTGSEVKVTYTEYDTETNYNGLTTANIPEKVIYSGFRYSVTAIDEDAFFDCETLTSLTIPNSVTSIGDWAFFGCSGLNSITIPNSVTSVGIAVVGKCDQLENLTVESGNTKYDSRNNCNAIIETATNTLISGCKNTIIPNSVTSIKERAFQHCSGLTSINIPSSVTKIEQKVFYYCIGLTSVNIGNSVSSIGKEVFYHCSGLQSIKVESGNSKYDSRNNCNAIIETATNTLITGCNNTIIPNTITSIGESAFADCEMLSSVAIPNSVISIGKYAFARCSRLTSVTIGTSVTSIGNYAFSVCSGLTSVTIPNSVTSIGQGVFDLCTGLTSVTIPNSVTSIGSWAFNSCSGLTSVTISNSVTSIGYEAFYGCSKLYSVVIPNSVTSIGQGAFNNCTGLESITVESGNSKYDSRNNCNAIIETASNTLITGCKNTIIPNSVTSIGEYAFYYNGLTSVNIPKSITSIGKDAFSGCVGLETITVESGNTKYDSRNNCNAIIETATNTLIAGCNNSIIPNTVFSIGDRAFHRSGVISVTIPNSVTSIGSEAFNGCKSLKEIKCKITDVWSIRMSYGVFYDVPTSTCVLKVPRGTVDDYRQANQWMDFENIIEDVDDLGDIDSNGYVDGIDLNILINIILGKYNADYYDGRANIDGQGGVDGSDINTLINIILGK